MEYLSPVGYSKRKKIYREYAKENLNLAVNENEYGEVAADIREQIVAEIKKRNKLVLSAQRLLSRSYVKVFTLPVVYLIFKLWLESKSSYPEIGRSFLYAGIVAVIMLVRHICLKILAENINMVSAEQVVNSKVALNEEEFVYSYSTVDPKRTDGKQYKNNNFFVKRMKYSDINSIAYNEKKKCYLIKGSYDITKYTDYRVNQPNPVYREETVLMNPMVIFDVYHSRDMFFELAKKAEKPIVADSTDEKRKGARRFCIFLFTVITMADAWIYLLILFYIALIISL